MMPRRTSVLLLSVVTHAVLLVALVLTSILAPGLLPVPQKVLAYYETRRIVRLDDIPLPRAPLKPGRAERTDGPVSIATNPDAAPLVSPDAIAPDTGHENAGTVTAGNVAVVENGDDVAGVGSVEAPPPMAPQIPIRLHSGIDTPRKVVDVTPAYPELARQTRTQGIVILEATISETGDVLSVRVLRSVRLLDQAAMDAVKQWKFSPARLNGQAISVVMTVTVNFALKP